jgi:hypothetical protein
LKEILKRDIRLGKRNNQREEERASKKEREKYSERGKK